MNVELDWREILLEALARYSYRYNARGFVLTSGKRTNEFIDCKLALCEARPLLAAGKLFLPLLDPRITVVGGLTMGADPVAIGTAQASAFTDHEVRWLSVRKVAKDHGLGGRIVGRSFSREAVGLFEDVITTGKSALEAFEALDAAGLTVVQVLALVDRQEDGGVERIRTAIGSDVPVQALFTKQQVRARWEQLALAESSEVR